MRLSDDEKRLIVKHLESPSVTDRATAMLYEKVMSDLLSRGKPVYRGSMSDGERAESRDVFEQAEGENL